jgi:SAM-dependent methyltransferase
MRISILPLLRCPLSGAGFELRVISPDTERKDKISEGILMSSSGAVFPVLHGLPRMLPDAMLEHRDFLRRHLPDFDQRLAEVMQKFGSEIRLAEVKNRKTRNSFSREWSGYDYETGKTWNLDATSMLEQFLKESGEAAASLQGKIILDAGCGNGHLSMGIAGLGAEVFAMDFSTAVLEASRKNTALNCHFLQADVEHPPFRENTFSLVHSSGVLIHTRNTRNSFLRLLNYVKPGGKISIWVYRRRSEWLHLLFNQLRRYTSCMPAYLQIPYLRLFVFLPAFLLKKIRGSKQNAAALWVEVLDWFTPEFRHEHREEEVMEWYREGNCRDICLSDENHWGFSVFGTRLTAKPE